MRREDDNIYGGQSLADKKREQAELKSQQKTQFHRDLIKNRIWTLILSLIVFIAIGVISWVLLKVHLKNQPTTTETARYERLSQLRRGGVSEYGLSKETDWTLAYEEGSSISGIIPDDCELTTAWIKRAAYHIIAGEQAFQQRKLDSSKRHYEKVAKIFPDIQGLYEKLGNIYLDQTNYLEAVSAYTRVLEEATNSYQVANNLGVAYMGAQKYPEAQKYFQMAYNIRPDYKQACRNLASLYKKNNQPEKSITYFEKYMRLAPEDMNTAQMFALTLTEQGKWERAADVMQELTTKVTDVPPLYFLQAQIEAHLGHAEKSIAALKRGIQLVDYSYAVAWMSKDEFDSIRQSKAFRDLINQSELDTIMGKQAE